MPNGRMSLLGGRRQGALDDNDVRRATNTFLGLDKNCPPTRYDVNSNTTFQVARAENGEVFGEIVFGPDIYPGGSVVDPNSGLGLTAAAAHEIAHFHRWNDKTQFTLESLEHIDEALTSLEAVIRYGHKFGQDDIRQLVSDAIQRLNIYVQLLDPPAPKQEG